MSRLKSFSSALAKAQRRIELTFLAVSREMQKGRHNSLKKGDSGEEILEYREYQPGDDIRLISWPVSERAEKLIIEEIKETRSMPALLIADMSNSMLWQSGLSPKSKAEVLFDLIVLIAFAAVNQGDSVGAVIHNGLKPKWFEPKGTAEIATAIARRVFLGAGPPDQENRAAQEADFIKQSAKYINKPSHVVVMSDFLFPPDDLKRYLKRIKSRGCDIIAIVISDPAEIGFGKRIKRGRYIFKDLESGELRFLDEKEIKNIRQKAEEHFAKIKHIFNSSGVNDAIFLKTDEKYLAKVIKLFFKRQK